MMSCKELIKNVNSEEELPFFKRAELRMHLMMCKHCSNYVKHLELMKSGFKKLFRRLGQVENSKIRSLEKKILEKNQRPKD